uniref:2-oxoadipate dioxygenase/decarboxylase family protein n=1 Tax=Pseudomonas sp. RL_35y_Pfl2_P42 TaxID=3088710 RepID=UPI0030DA44B0
MNQGHSAGLQTFSTTKARNGFHQVGTISCSASLGDASLEDLLRNGYVKAEPLVYEDFLPVSAAGIFQSNLGDAAQAHYGEHSNRQAFEQALGRSTIDELGLYAQTQQRSIEECVVALESRQ